jgi:hypothetical protein
MCQKKDLKKPREDILLQKKTAANIPINIDAQMLVDDGCVSIKLHKA